MNDRKDDNGNDRKEENDEETPPPPTFPPREISFNRRHHNSTRFGDDDDTVPSELSALIAPSTLTPNNGGYDPELLVPGGAGDLTRRDSQSSSGLTYSRKAFRLAVLLGMVSMGGLFGGDAAYMMVSRSASEEEVVQSRDITMSSTKKEAKAAKKTKAGKKQLQEEERNEVMASIDDEADEDDERDDEEEDDEDDGDYDDEGNELITTPQREAQDDEGLRVPTPGMIAAGIVVPAIGGDNDRDMAIPQARERCPHVIETFERQNADVTNPSFLREKYAHQSADPNVFYRATALLFWKDFGEGAWGRDEGASVDFEELVRLGQARYEDGAPLSPMSTWTWITGDQHLSNFGAWRNRGGEVVYSVNDFDEAAIYDFHVDVLRVAVSICSHGFTNGLAEEDVRVALEAFTYTYVKTAIDYVGGDAALVYELTPDTSTGALRDFLSDVEEERSTSRQLHKFTEVGPGGDRRFVRNAVTRLEDVEPEVEEKIRAEMTSTRYGASMMKMGWKVRGWDDDFFTVLDVARRVGSGVGSYGVDRFYILLKGEDALLKEDGDGDDASNVILDVKYEPESAVSTILEEVDPETRAWYGDMFRNEADRAAQAQRRLTSYTDPYVGYLVIDGNSYNVRQRSPYKSSFDLETLTHPRAFNEFMEQVAIATATAHVRGTVAKSPGQFKHVIKLLLAGDRNRRRWSDLVAKIALSYRRQVLLDFECFKDYVERDFPST